MMRIQSLLNPPEAKDGGLRRKEIPTSHSTRPRALSSPDPPPKRQKLTKDAPIFNRSKPKGEVRYPPHEAGDDEELASEQKRFQVYPMGHIGEFARHIPYNSEKKSFLAKTGREAFEGKYPPAVDMTRLILIQILCSLPVHIQSSWRREGIYRHVGL
jgi:hypothetical protein